MMLQSVMNRPLLKEALLPTLLLGGLWLAFSLATTVYIAWLDTGYQRVLEENVASIRASSEMQGVLWRLHDTVAQSLDPATRTEGLKRLDLEFPRLQASLESSDASAITEPERREIETLRNACRAYQQLVTNIDRDIAPDPAGASRIRDRSRALALRISGSCNRLRELNDALINEDSARRRSWNHWIGSTRIVLAFLGPILGIWLGFRAASRARRRLGDISVRLEGASGELGRLHLSSAPKQADFDDLDEQVAAITRRLDSVLTQLDSARHEILRSERLAAVGQLAAGVAHELRNPLTSVKLLVQVVARDQQQESANSKPLRVVLDEIDRMERTIQSLLDFARPPAQKRLRHDLRETLGRAMNLVELRAARDGVVIVPDLPCIPFEIDGDPEQLQQVFVNLLLNGLEAMPGGGKVHVCLHLEEPDLESADSVERTCIVEVSDDGSGIPEKVIEHLFEPFVTSKERGTGLGLAVSRRIIEEHGGTLTAANGSSGGAVISVRLVLASPIEELQVA